MPPLKNRFTVEKTESMILRANLTPEVSAWLKSLKGKGEKCNVTTNALEFYHDYLHYRKGFLIRILEVNFDRAKHLLRQLGRVIKAG